MIGWNGRSGTRAVGRGLIAIAAIVAALIASLATSAHAQDYPTRAVKIIVPFPAGGSADVVPRIVAEWLSR
jgi:tripartite-type tricarboxylate transporter receptor subunit TctC